MKWADIKKEVRHWYGYNLRAKIEPTLRKIGFTYVVDMNPYDWDNIKLNQKSDRQIIFIVAGILWFLETIYDYITAPAPGTKKVPAAKSFLKKDTATSQTKDKRSEREKIE